MSCEYCHSYPHLPGCPNAPEPAGIQCTECGGTICIGDLYFDSSNGPICKECIDEMSASDVLELAGESMTELQEEERW